MIVLAIKRNDGRLEFPLSGDEIFAPGDSIVLMGQREKLQQFRDNFAASPTGPEAATSR